MFLDKFEVPPAHQLLPVSLQKGGGRIDTAAVEQT